MGTCKYCGLSCGLFRKSHEECENKHNQGIQILEDALRSYLSDQINVGTLKKKIDQVKSGNFVSDPDIAISSAKCIDEFTERIHWPFHSVVLTKIKEFLANIGIPYNTINVNGSLDRLSQKMVRGFMAEYFTGRKDLSRSLQISQQIMQTLPLSYEQRQDAYLHMLNQAGKNYLKDGLMSDTEQHKIDEYVNTLGIQINQLPAKYQDSEISKLGQATILKEIQKGIIPNTGLTAPIILGKNESVLWSYGGVSLYQEKITKEWVGRSRGMSFRVMKGVYYHTGGSKGHPVEHSRMELQGTGSLFVTNKNLIFYSQSKGLKIPFNKIVGITPYSDGIEVHKDGANAKRITMQGFDPWFLMNMLSLISNLS